MALVEPVPLSIITGFLGAGKTTLINALMCRKELRNTALIINEFGDVSIDHHLVETADEEIIELSNGCVCCSVRGALVDAIENILDRRREQGEPIARILVETTGLADPAPILHAIMAHPRLVCDVRLDGVIVVVDAINTSNTLDQHPQAVKQIALADRVILSKTDLVLDRGALQALKVRLARLNPAAGSKERLIDNSDQAVEPHMLFNCGLYDPTTRTTNVERWLGDPGHSNHSHEPHTHAHDAAIRSFSLTNDKPMSMGDLDMFFSLLETLHGPKLLRLKGIVQLADDPERPMVIHAVQDVFHPPFRLAEWPKGLRHTKLVIITKDLPEKSVRQLFDTFSGNAAIDTPDRAALAESPLSIPGMASMKF